MPAHVTGGFYIREIRVAGAIDKRSRWPDGDLCAQQKPPLSVGDLFDVSKRVRWLMLTAGNHMCGPQAISGNWACQVKYKPGKPEMLYHRPSLPPFHIGHFFTMVSVRALIQISRVDRMAGTMILFWPFAWSLTMSARQAKLPLVNYLEALFIGFIGACLLHSGGCVWDDIVDMDFDAQVERTKNRPLPGGRITVPEASAFLAVHIVLLFALSHGLDHVSQTLAFLTIVPFTGLYPYMKRITNLPQVWLGITLHIPVMLASQVMLGHISTASIYLFLGCSMWTLWYDAIYSCPDKKDDAKAGVKSITFLLGDHIKTGLTVFAGCLVAAWLACGILNQSGLIYYLVTVIGGASLLAHRTYGTDLDNDLACHKTFESSAWTIGPAVFGGFLLDYLVSH